MANKIVNEKRPTLGVRTQFVNPDNVNPHWQRPAEYGLVPAKEAAIKVETTCIFCGK